MAKPQEQMIIRVPAEVKEWVEHKAQSEDRSMNRVILRALRQAMASPLEPTAHDNTASE